MFRSVGAWSRSFGGRTAGTCHETEWQSDFGVPDQDGRSSTPLSEPAAAQHPPSVVQEEAKEAGRSRPHPEQEDTQARRPESVECGHEPQKREVSLE